MKTFENFVTDMLKRGKRDGHFVADITPEGVLLKAHPEDKDGFGIQVLISGNTLTVTKYAEPEPEAVEAAAP